jgi:hypothetical protein
MVCKENIMITLVHPKHGTISFAPGDSLTAVYDYLNRGYKLVNPPAPGYTVFYISVDRGSFWVRPGQAKDREPRLRINSATRFTDERVTLSVPMAWVKSPETGVARASLVLATTGFGFDYFYPCRETVGPALQRCIKSLREKLLLGNTCLQLPKRSSVIVSFTNRGKNNFYVEPCEYRGSVPDCVSSCALYIPESFTTTQTEETEMDIVSLVMAEQLYAIAVEFSKGGQRYTYKSQTEIPVGAKVVVDSPTTGLVVVTVVDCKQGLDTATSQFSAYKWIVDQVNVAEYNRLLAVEHDMVQKAKAKKRLDEAKKQLEELGFTTEELIAMVKGND